jgi:sterol 24-C-methyltransferase
VGTTTTSESIEKREKEYATMVNSFYDLVTDFYEWGWGQVSYIACTLSIIICI